MDQPRALRELQAALQVRIDRLYAPLPAEVRRTFRRYRTGDVLTYTSAALILAAIENLLRSVDDRTVPIIAQGMAAATILPTLWDPLESTCRHASLSIL